MNKLFMFQNIYQSVSQEVPISRDIYIKLSDFTLVACPPITAFIYEKSGAVVEGSPLLTNWQGDTDDEKGKIIISSDNQLVWSSTEAVGGIVMNADTNKNLLFEVKGYDKEGNELEFPMPSRVPGYDINVPLNTTLLQSTLDHLVLTIKSSSEEIVNDGTFTLMLPEESSLQNTPILRISLTAKEAITNNGETIIKEVAHELDYGSYSTTSEDYHKIIINYNDLNGAGWFAEFLNNTNYMDQMIVVVLDDQSNTTYSASISLVKNSLLSGKNITITLR